MEWIILRDIFMQDLLGKIILYYIKVAQTTYVTLGIHVSLFLLLDSPEFRIFSSIPDEDNA